MPLTNIAIKSAKPKDKQYKLSDKNGLYLLVHPNGGKYWQLKYRFVGKEKTYSLGVYDEVSLQEARDKALDARKSIKNGIDPSAEKSLVKKLLKQDYANNFEAIALQWHEQRKHMWTEKHAAKILRVLKTKLFPAIGNIPINQVKPPELLAALKKIEKDGHLHTAHRMQQTASQIFRFAVASGLTERDIAVDLRGALKPSKKTNYARLSENELSEFIEKLENYEGDEQTKIATKLLMITFVRTIELRGARWEEINFDKAEWRIPAERMKMRKPHIVPLSKQAIALFRQQQQSTGNYDFVFPNRNRPTTYISENTILYAIYRMGYHNRTTAHGFRGTASTILHESGLFDSVHIERQLAHGERNQSKGSYDHSQHLAKRAEMMQWWGDYIDGVKK